MSRMLEKQMIQERGRITTFQIVAMEPGEILISTSLHVEDWQKYQKSKKGIKKNHFSNYTSCWSAMITKDCWITRENFRTQEWTQWIVLLKRYAPYLLHKKGKEVVVGFYGVFGELLLFFLPWEKKKKRKAKVNCYCFLTLEKGGEKKRKAMLFFYAILCGIASFFCRKKKEYWYLTVLPCGMQLFSVWHRKKQSFGWEFRASWIHLHFVYVPLMNWWKRLVLERTERNFSFSCDFNGFNWLESDGEVEYY